VIARCFTYRFEAPRAAVLHYLEARLVMTIDQLVGNTARRPLVGQLKRLGAKPLHTDNRDGLVRENASERGSRREIFKLGHVELLGN
jgi:hypothetical protein